MINSFLPIFCNLILEDEFYPCNVIRAWQLKQKNQGVIFTIVAPGCGYLPQLWSPLRTHNVRKLRVGSSEFCEPKCIHRVCYGLGGVAAAPPPATRNKIPNWNCIKNNSFSKFLFNCMKKYYKPTNLYKNILKITLHHSTSLKKSEFRHSLLHANFLLFWLDFPSFDALN